MLTSLGGAGLLTLRSEPSDHPVQRALGIMALPLILLAALLVAPILDSERQVRALVRTLRLRRVTVVAAFLTALGTPTTALAAAAGVAASAFSDVGPGSLVGSLTVWTLVLATAIGVWGRQHERTKTRSATTFAAGVALIAIASVSLVLAW